MPSKCAAEGWPQAYNKWIRMEKSPAWYQQYELLHAKAIEILKVSKPDKAPRKDREIREKEAKEKKLQEEIMKKGEEMGLNFSALTKPTKPNPKAKPTSTITSGDLQKALVEEAKQSNKSQRFNKMFEGL